jgi:hypothetical protein
MRGGQKDHMRGDQKAHKKGPLGPCTNRRTSDTLLRRSGPSGRPPKSREEVNLMRTYYVKVFRHMLSTAVLTGFITVAGGGTN